MVIRHYLNYIKDVLLNRGDAESEDSSVICRNNGL